MRILLTGQDQVLSRGVIARLSDQHELLCLNQGGPRQFVGCQLMVHLWSEHTSTLELAARNAGVKRIIRVVHWPADPPAEVDTCIIVLAPLIGPEDPAGTRQDWIDWAHQDHDDPSGKTAVLDHRDALGGIESAIWKGRAGAVYRLAGPTPDRAKLQEILRAHTHRAASHQGAELAGPPLINSMDTGLAQAELGWWHRSLEQSLKDTVAGL